jgi:putative PIG3 family NAD(P)H quinone oxidoreductase
MDTMRAMVTQEDNSLRWQEVPVPSLERSDVLIDTFATALNRADLAQKRGLYPPPAGASTVLGLEVAGVVRKVGWEVDQWQVGDAVCALLPGGGYAEAAVVPQDLLMPVPVGWTFAQAAALPEVFFTAFLNVFLEANLDKGEWVLIHGGASGVGTAAIQLVKHAGSNVVVTASNEDKLAMCRSLGADLAINYQTQDFAEVIRDSFSEADGSTNSGTNSGTNGGIDVVLDMVGAPYLAKHLDVLNNNGRLVIISTLGGKQAELDLRTLMSKRIAIKGSTLRSRPLHEKIHIKEQFMKRFWRLIEQGAIHPVIDSIYPIDEVEAAHEHMRQNRNIGKIVLQVRQESG